MTRATRLAGCLITGLLLLAGCTHGSGSDSAVRSDADSPPLKLVAFDSCADLLDGLRGAAKAVVGPYGFGGSVRVVMGESGPAPLAPDAAGVSGGAAAADAPKALDHSTTNTHEPGVDEPDLVKTDGKRIVTVTGGVLRVVDAATRRLTGSLTLDAGGADRRAVERLGRGGDAQLLLARDRVLVLIHGGGVRRVAPGPIIDDEPVRPIGSRLVLVDLTGGPHITGRYTVDGNLLDARQVADTARVVVHSTPQVPFPLPQTGSDADRIAANQTAIDRAPIDDWLPSYTVTDASGKAHDGRVDCTAVSRPAVYTGTSLLTVLTFDLGKPELGTGDPISLAADGNTVYGTGTSLYVANTAVGPKPVRTGTELYKFDTADRARPPRFVAAGRVPGYLLSQYALSEWQGHLRVATTSAPPWEPFPVEVVPGGAPPGIDGRPLRATTRPSRPPTESTVYVLAQRGGSLVETGHVGGLGKGERIYAVRFLDGTGYVVTFRQTDPLYTLDLRDPAAPKVVGELKINGYSAYLHPAGDGRLIGIGQATTERGLAQGTQVSLFDVADPAHPVRLAVYQVVGYGHSEAEFDPHAFLYWPAQQLLVVPVMSDDVSAGALELRVADSGFTELGTLRHATTATNPYAAVIRRSLMIGDTLWTVSDAGLAADRPGQARLGWLPFG
jgi:hypothetical protein